MNKNKTITEPEQRVTGNGRH